MNRRSLISGAAACLGAFPILTQSARAQDAGKPARIRDLYERGTDLSDFANSGAGTRLTFEGFMAPPLKADTQFFVLTKMPMSVCPFCETSAEWPNDILAIYTKRKVKVIPFNRKIEVRGVLELGAYRDPETGFVSMVRLTDAIYG